jgi:hypothetical protein
MNSRPTSIGGSLDFVRNNQEYFDFSSRILIAIMQAEIHTIQLMSHASLLITLSKMAK